MAEKNQRPQTSKVGCMVRGPARLPGLGVKKLPGTIRYEAKFNDTAANLWHSAHFLDSVSH